MARPSGNLQRTGVTGHTLTRTVSDLLRSRKPFLIRHNSSRHILREAGQIDEGPEDEHLGTGAFPLTWSTGTGGSDRGWYRPAQDLWHYWPASGWFNLRRMRRQPSSERLSMRTDPALDLRRVLLYAAALVAIYTVGVVVILATHTPNDPQLGVLIIMFAPMSGALLARFAGPGVIRWGRLSWWILAGLLPVVTVFV